LKKKIKIEDLKMKKGIHPDYRPIVFQDPSCEFAILTRSTMKSSETIKWTDGNTYPLVKLEISSGSHPYFTGKQKLVDTAGRVEKFQKKYSAKKSSKN
jgi:large subunit ribosomal protein L31